MGLRRCKVMMKNEKKWTDARANNNKEEALK